MRKITALLIVLALMLMCAPALAAGENNVTHDFEDLTLTYPGDMILDEGEKTDPQLYFYLYSMDTSPDYFTNNLNAVWDSNYQSVEDVSPQAMLDYTVDSIGETIENMGLEIYNLTGDSAERLDLGGKAALSFSYSYEYDRGGIRMDMKNHTVIVSDSGLGTYTFAITAVNDEGVDALMEVLNGIEWH